MLYLGNIPKRYFDLILRDGRTLNVEVSTLKDVTTLSDIVREPMQHTMDEIMSVVASILTRNRQVISIDMEYVKENFSYDDVSVLIKEYLIWLKNGERDPN